MQQTSGRTTAIVLAAGTGSRMHADEPKQFMKLGGKRILDYSLEQFERFEPVSRVIIVTSAPYVQRVRQAAEEAGFDKVTDVICGGANRYDSVYEGLLAAEGCDYVMIHDAARPFIDAALLQRNLDLAKECGASVCGMPCKDTIKICDPNGVILRTPERSGLYIVQTPQSFAYSLIREAHETVRAQGMDGITDDAMVVERASGCRVRISEGSYANIKITTPEDLACAQMLLRQ